MEQKIYLDIFFYISIYDIYLDIFTGKITPQKLLQKQIRQIPQSFFIEVQRCRQFM